MAKGMGIAEAWRHLGANLDKYPNPFASAWKRINYDIHRDAVQPDGKSVKALLTDAGYQIIEKVLPPGT